MNETRLCAALMDELNDVFADNRTAHLAERPVVSAHKTAGLSSPEHLILKNKVLGQLSQCFIDKQVVAVKKCELYLFATNEGFDVVTVFESPERACFYMRGDYFDIIVEYTA